MSDTVNLIIGAFLLAANAFFVGAEFAVISARRAQIEPLAQRGSRAAKITIYAMENVSDMLACAQLGITVCSLGLGAIAKPALKHVLEVPLSYLPVGENLPGQLAFPLAFAIIVYLHVVAGEMIPKNFALALPDRVVLTLAPPLVFIARLTSPLLIAMNWIANAVLRLFGVQPKDEVTSAFTAEQVQSMVDESRRSGLLDSEGDLLSGVLEFSDQLAAEVSVPTAQLVTVPQNVTPALVEQRVAETGFSRFPVSDADGKLTGYLHLKDVLRLPSADRDKPVPDSVVRELLPIDGSSDVGSVLELMQLHHSHLGVIHDAAGVSGGVVFLEDVLEELVGEIADTSNDSTGSPANT